MPRCPVCNRPQSPRCRNHPQRSHGPQHAPALASAPQPIRPPRPQRNVPLTDPWFEAQYTAETDAQGWRRQDTLEGADGLWLWCPCGYGSPDFPLAGPRPHAVIVSFANPRGCPPAPPDAGSQSRSGGPSRWMLVSGSGLVDLTLSPSIDVGTPSCWHGWIKNGIVEIP